MADSTKRRGVEMTPKAKAAADRIAERMKGRDSSRLAAFLADPEQQRQLDEAAIVEAIVSTLQAAIEAAGVSRYEIAKRTGITQSLLSRLVNGERPNVTIETLAKLAVELGLTVRVERPKRRGK